MHISSVAALVPDLTVRFALSPVLLYVHDHVRPPAPNVWNCGLSQRTAVGCSQSVVSTSIDDPSRTFASTPCLCWCVVICQNFTPAGVGQVAWATTPVAPGPIEMSWLYVLYAAV